MTLVPGSSLFKFLSLRRKIEVNSFRWQDLKGTMKSLKWTYNKTGGICPWLQLLKPPNFSEKARREGGPNGDVEERMSPQRCQTSACHKFSVWRNPGIPGKDVLYFESLLELKIVNSLNNPYERPIIFSFPECQNVWESFLNIGGAIRCYTNLKSLW